MACVSVFGSWASAPVAMMALAAKSAATIVVPRIGMCRPRYRSPTRPSYRIAGEGSPGQRCFSLRRSLHHPLIHGLGILLQRLARFGAEIEHVASGINLHLDGRRAGERGQLTDEEGRREIGRDEVGVAAGDQ